MPYRYQRVKQSIWQNNVVCTCFTYNPYEYVRFTGRGHNERTEYVRFTGRGHNESTEYVRFTGRGHNESTEYVRFTGRGHYESTEYVSLSYTENNIKCISIIKDSVIATLSYYSTYVSIVKQMLCWLIKRQLLYEYYIVARRSWFNIRYSILMNELVLRHRLMLISQWKIDMKAILIESCEWTIIRAQLV